MTIVVLPDGRNVRFPNDMPREQIKAYIDGKQQPQTIEEARAQSNAPEWMKKIADRMVAEGRTELTAGEKAEAILRGGLGGASDLGGRALSGATFGASDWAARKAGVNPTKGIEDMIDNASSERQAGLIGLVSGMNEMTGAFPTGGAVYKGVGKGLASLPKVGRAVKYATPAVSGAITGGAYGGFQGDSAEAIGRGAARGALFGLVADAIGRGLSKGLSAVDKIKNTPRGFENAVATKTGAKVLNRAVRESDKIAEQVYGKAPEALENLNARAADTLDDAVLGKPIQQSNMQKLLGGTAVVDKSGKPIIVYHGTGAKFDTFNSDAPIYFADNKDVAKWFAIYGKNGQNAADRRIVNAYLSMKKPLVVDAKGSAFGDIPFNGEKTNTATIAKFAKDKGYDGVIVRNVKEAGGYEIPTNDYVVFDPKQVIPADQVKTTTTRGVVAAAKKNYADFLDANKSNQIIKGQQDLSALKGTAIVDKKGNPLKLYHGTNENFDTFKVGEHGGTFGTGIYAGDKNVANGYGNVKALYINSKNPYRTTDVDYRKLAGEASKAYQAAQKTGKLPEGLDDLIYDDDIINWYLKGKGFDSIIGRNSNGYNEYVAFDPKQITMAKNDIPKPSDLGLKDLTANQKMWLNRAWTEGQRNTLEKAGSLGHLNEMSKELNKMIQASRTPNPTGVGTVATSDTVAIQGLKDKLDDVITNSGLKGIKTEYAQAKAVEEAYNQGLKFNPNSIKTRDIRFNSPAERSAFAEGIVEKAKINPDSKNIAGKARDLRGALKVALGKDAQPVLKEIDQIDRAYKNVEKILGNAERKLVVPDAIGRNTGLIREYLESPGSVIGGTVDMLRKLATANSSARATKYLLNPELPMGKPLYDVIQQYLPSSAVILKESKTKRKEKK